MTMFEFMQNAFFLLCGIACIAVAFIIIYIALNVVIRGINGGKPRGGRVPIDRSKYAKEKNDGGN